MAVLNTSWINLLLPLNTGSGRKLPILVILKGNKVYGITLNENPRVCTSIAWGMKRNKRIYYKITARLHKMMPFLLFDTILSCLKSSFAANWPCFHVGQFCFIILKLVMKRFTPLFFFTGLQSLAQKDSLPKVDTAVLIKPNCWMLWQLKAGLAKKYRRINNAEYARTMRLPKKKLYLKCCNGTRNIGK